MELAPPPKQDPYELVASSLSSDPFEEYKASAELHVQTLKTTRTFKLYKRVYCRTGKRRLDYTKNRRSNIASTSEELVVLCIASARSYNTTTGLSASKGQVGGQPQRILAVGCCKSSWHEERAEILELFSLFSEDYIP